MQAICEGPDALHVQEHPLHSTRCAPVCFLEGIVEIVDDGYIVTMLKETKHCVRAWIQADPCQSPEHTQLADAGFRLVMNTMRAAGSR